MGRTFIEENMNAILQQTYRPLQVIISDHSKDDIIHDYIKNINAGDIEIIYVKYGEHYGSPCHNWNNALKYATGSYIQYLALDDMLASSDAVEKAIMEMKRQPTAKWFATAHKIHQSSEVFVPKWNSMILQRNTLSGPSAIIVRSELKHVKLDPDFIWYLDLDWYYRLFKEGGIPGIISHIHWINRKHPFQLTHIVCDMERRNAEKTALEVKYGKPLPSS